MSAGKLFVGWVEEIRPTPVGGLFVGPMKSSVVRVFLA